MSRYKKDRLNEGLVTSLQMIYHILLHTGEVTKSASSHLHRFWGRRCGRLVTHLRKRTHNFRRRRWRRRSELFWRRRRSRRRRRRRSWFLWWWWWGWCTWSWHRAKEWNSKLENLCFKGDRLVVGHILLQVSLRSLLRSGNQTPKKQ